MHFDASASREDARTSRGEYAPAGRRSHGETRFRRLGERARCRQPETHRRGAPRATAQAWTRSTVGDTLPECEPARGLAAMEAWITVRRKHASPQARTSRVVGPGVLSGPCDEADPAAPVSPGRRAVATCHRKTKRTLWRLAAPQRPCISYQLPATSYQLATASGNRSPTCCRRTCPPGLRTGPSRRASGSPAACPSGTSRGDCPSRAAPGRRR